MMKVDLRTGAEPGPEQITLITAHCTVIAVDIAGFGAHHRNNINQVRVRHGMYRAMQEAFTDAGVHWDACYREDRGDGVLLLAHADVSKSLFVDRLPNALVKALVRHNRLHPPAEKLRLRLALHAGEINYDQHGVTGSAINHTFRLLDAATAKEALANSSAVLAVVGSAWFFDEVIRHSEWSQVKAYRPIDVTNKETATSAWVRLLRGRAATCADPTIDVPHQGL
jgi:class 3 adenylate cyclase